MKLTLANRAPNFLGVIEEMDPVRNSLFAQARRKKHQQSNLQSNGLHGITPSTLIEYEV